MLTIVTDRPREVGTLRAAAILYGDLGTSKAYVIGLAFAAAGYSSFWLIAAVSLLTVLVGINYTVICRCYPNGGGVYASVRRRSEMIALMGAFFLIADYMVTAALSALSAFHYLGVSDPPLFAAIAIGVIGILNYFGPRHTGSLAFIIAVAAVAGLTILLLFSLPHASMAWHNIRPLQGSIKDIWVNFVGVIVALSGIEAIANTTGVMKLNRGTTYKNPSVTKTSTKAIVIVIAEVAIYTTFFAFIASAIGNFQISGGEVSAPGESNVRDSMLRYLSQIFVGGALGSNIGNIFTWIFSFTIGILLLSAVNTAMTGLVAVQYIMAGDGEFPKMFQKVNRFGVPLLSLLVAVVTPILLVLRVEDIEKLSTLYAIGFVGAIATNLASTSTDFSLDLKIRERVVMFFTFLIMFAIEITLFVEKPHARIYAITIVTVGLVLRGFVRERKAKELQGAMQTIKSKSFPVTQAPYSIICAVHTRGKTLDEAIHKSLTNGYPLHILFIREQSIITEADSAKSWEKDPEAIKVLELINIQKNELLHSAYIVTDSSLDIILAWTSRLGANEVMIEDLGPRKLSMWGRRRLIKKLKKNLPPSVKLSIEKS